MSEQTDVVELTRSLIRIDTTNGNETAAADHLAEYLADAGVEAEVVARTPERGNLVARIPGSDRSAPSLAFVGHLDVVPADARDWRHPPFEAVVDDDGWLWGRGAIDMKNEVAARTAAFARLAREGFAPRGDLWLVMVADEEDGAADVGMRWLLEQRTDVRPTMAVNEGGGERLPLTDGREMLLLEVGEKGTCPVRVHALGEAGHASMPEVGDNAVPHLAPLLAAIGRGMPTHERDETVDAMLEVLLGRAVGDYPADLAAAAALHPALAASVPALPGTTMAPTMLGGSSARNVMPARAWVELDCRTLPGTSDDEVLAQVRARLEGAGTAYELELTDASVLGSRSASHGAFPDAVAGALADLGDTASVMPSLCPGFTDSVFLRQVGTAAYGFSPFRTTPAEVLTEGYHNADERVHVDDLHYSVAFHLALARRLLGRDPAGVRRRGSA